jgi:uncharacterized protein (TIGR04255 family)
MPVEMFGPGQSFIPPQIQIGFGGAPVRHWFVSEDENELIQLQQDWLAVNWRKRPDGTESVYRRYPERIESFVAAWNELAAFLEGQKLAGLLPVQCEVTYVNHIPVGQGGLSDFGHGGAFTHLLGGTPVGFPAEPQGVGFRTNYVVSDDDGRPFARLHLQIDSAILNETEQKILLVNLTFRGRPFSPDIEGVIRLFDSGHNWIVGAFDELTTTLMHNTWIRRERDSQ